LSARKPAEALRTSEEDNIETWCASEEVMTFELSFSMLINLFFSGLYALNVKIDIDIDDYERGNV